LDRRFFIKLTAVTGTSAALASCGHPENELIRFVPDEDIVPGTATWKPGVCTLCAAGCGLTVRVMDADMDVVRDGQAGVKKIYAAKKLEGAPMHPVNQGGLCARGQAAIQVTYHPDRITQPLKRTGNRGAGTYEAISWDDAIAELVTKLDELEAAGNQKALAFLGRRGRSHRAAVIGEFLARFGAPPAVTYELFGDEVLRRANGRSFGRAQLPTFDLARANYVISFGADFLGTWNSPVSQAAAYGAMRQGRPGIRGALVQVESRMSQTGANADEWVPARPGTEGVLALGVAHVILSANLRPAANAGPAGALLEGWSSGLSSYTPEEVEKRTGVAARRIERLARAFAERAPSVAIVGGAPLAHSNGLFTALAVNALNALVGAVEQPGGLFFTPQFDVAAAGKLAGSTAPGPTVQQLLASTPQLLVLDGANPVFTSPTAWKVRETLERVPFIVSVGHFLDETSVLADLILPDHTFLETWSDGIPESGAMTGVASVAAPVMAPLYATRSTGDLFLDLGRRLRRPIELPWMTMEEMLTATFATLPAATEGGDPWSEAQEKGGWWGPLPAAVTVAAPRAEADGALASSADPQFDGDASFPFHFLPFASSAFLDGSLAHLPWLQEMPDPTTSAMWSSWVEINPATAEKLGINTGDVVELASSQGTIRTAAMITPGIAPDVLAMPAGQGHTNFTRYATGRGANPVQLVAPITVEGTDALAWAATRVKITRVGDPDGRLVLFAGGHRDHDGQHQYGHAGRG
jgi:menaquinone reductase, molybdopterin-binding-like subunit